MVSRASSTPGAAAPEVGLRGSATRGWLLFVFVMVALAAARLPVLGRPVETQDEAIVLVYAQQTLDGRLPHRDFYTVYGPGVFGLTAGAFAVLGPQLLAERLVGLCLQAAVVSGVLALALDRSRRAAVGAALLCVLVLTPLNLVACAWIGGLACIAWGMVLLRRGNLLAAGLLLGLSALFRPEMIVPAYASAVPLTLGRFQLHRILPAVLTGLAPSALYYGLVGRRALDNIVLQRGAVDARLEANPLSVLLIVLAAAVVALLLVSAVWGRQAHLWSFFIFALLTMPQLLQRSDHDHLAYVLAVPAPLALLALGDLGLRSWGLVAGARGALAALLGLIVVQPVLHHGEPSVPYAVGDRHVVLTKSDAKLVDGVRKAVLGKVPAGASLFLGTQEMARPSLTPVILYFLLPELRAQPYYLEMPVGVTPTVGRALARDVARANVVLLTDFSPEGSRAFAPHVPRGPGDADAMVQRRFCRVATDPLAVMVPCARFTWGYGAPSALADLPGE